MFTLSSLLLIAGCNDGKDPSSPSVKVEALPLRENSIRHLWNGKYFIHQFPLGCSPVDDKEDLLLPEGAVATKVLLNGMPVAFQESIVGESHYVDFSAGNLKGRADMEILF